MSFINGKCELCGIDAIASSQSSSAISCSRCKTQLGPDSASWVALWHSPLPPRQNYPDRRKPEVA